MDMQERAQPMPEDEDVMRSLRLSLKRRASVAERLQVLAEAANAAPHLAVEIGRSLSEMTEQDVMFDDVLRLLKVWWHHRRGEAAERDYYLHAFRSADDRSRIREYLGIARPSWIERLVVLITVDCLRAGQLSCNGYPKPTTPAIDGLAASGVNFTRTYSTAGQTAQSFPGILLSNFFQNFGRSRAVPEHLVTLAEALSRNGFYGTAHNAANPHVSHFYGYDKGFDEFTDFLGAENFSHTDETFVDDSPKRLTRPSEAELMAISKDCQAHPDVYEMLRELTGLEGLPLVGHIAGRARFYPYDAADLVKGAIGDILAPGSGANRFCWLHLMDLHENITVPFSRMGSFTPVQRFFLNTLLATPLGVEVLRSYAGKYQELYDSAVSYVDMNVEILLNFLSDSGLLDSSLVCLTADHGQELLENGVFGHGYDRLVEGLVHVPLVFGGGLAERIDASGAGRPVSSLDVAPTILDVCDVDDTPETFLGRTLNDLEPRPVYGQTFYDGADNRCSDRTSRAFELKPFPQPVRESCKMILYCIEGGYQLIHDAGRGTTQLHKLASAAPSERDAQPPDAGRLRRQAEDFFDGAYALPEEDYAFELSGQDRQLVEARLQDLGYL
jgi:arylsulfatase A-like enzyme